MSKHPKAEAFARLYAEGKGILRIAAELHMGGTTARQLRDELGLAPRRPGYQNQHATEAVQRAAERYRQGGISQPAAAAQFGLRHYQLRYHLMRQRQQDHAAVARAEAACQATRAATEARIREYDRQRRRAGGVPWALY